MAKSSTLNIPRPKPNYFLSIISIALVLFLLGMVAFLTWHAGRLMNSFKESINVIAELKDSTTAEQADEVVTFLQEYQVIKPGSVEFIGKEKALEIMKKEMGEDFLLDEMNNPLYDVVAFNIKSPYFSPEYLDTVKTTLSNRFPYISSVYYQETFVQKITASMRKIGIGTLIASVLFLIIALTVMHNTLRLAMYANRFLIKNMELVGASRNFIRAPYLKKSIGSGLLSGLVAVLLLAALIYGLYHFFPEVRAILDYQATGILFGGLILLGILLTLISTFFIINKYLNTRTTELF